ncbi:ATPase-like, ParA/MinD [Syntrophobotulus glycolicus DSM 8271]|uniref:Iron-sulfur cluster carrier protein n=1 Tax=Syntrophobotulus glycolicus (strain DSM 8271 / FlGlyR) TaxID=645991 RepID=F0SVZ9_SYNGF|nr:Mrp/NBP35 family ATP-binding protein [Syntrophobotulus glycolicus]ADY56783.1 ATPase-like, ParA/MinD [Syntrophobotulus glycolicus DSM 8271]
MSENCSQNCNSCSEQCSERKEETDFSEKLHEMSNVKKVIGIVSGKGGVGKSLVTSLLAVTMNRKGYHTAILDADITGPSIPKAFGITEKAAGDEFGLFPATSKTGIEIMSTNLLLPRESDAVIWRGPILGGVVKQFWSDVIWTDIDFMFIDMPPGTGDVPLTVFQSIPLDGIIVVASPQELVSMIVTKAVNMAKTMNIPIIGLVENLAYFKCPDCGNTYQIFGESSIDRVAAQEQLPVLAKLPIDPQIAGACDKGMIEFYEGSLLDNAAKILERLGGNENENSSSE